MPDMRLHVDDQNVNCVCGHVHDDNCLCGCTIYTPDLDEWPKVHINFGTAWHCEAGVGPQPKDWREVEISQTFLA